MAQIKDRLAGLLAFLFALDRKKNRLSKEKKETLQNTLQKQRATCADDEHKGEHNND